MNESRYFLFWLYNLDLHNLDREDLVAASDPRTDYRWQKTTVVEVDLTEIKKMNVDDIEIITEGMSNICVDEKPLFVCDVCGCGFKSAGYLVNHKKKHGEVVKPFLCAECDKILKSKRNLES